MSCSRVVLAIVLAAVGGCGGGAQSARRAGDGAAAAPTARGEVRTMRPYTPDPALERAPPVDVGDHATMLRWLQARVQAAYDGIEEHVRLPVIRRAEDMPCDCPPNAIAPTTRSGPFFWLRLDDYTGAGIPGGEWLGWVEGRFKAETAIYRTTDGGGIDMALTVFEVYSQRARLPSEPPHARFVRR